MNKLSEIYKKFIVYWKSISSSKKIAYSVLFFGVIAALITIGMTFGTTKYSTLFTNMNSTDSEAVITKLKADKVSYKVNGTAIEVPASQVDELRMEMMSGTTITNGSTGFELLDKTQLGATDQEIQVNYQRALQGELERTIKAFPQISNARVHLVIPSDTAFVSDTTPGSASVTLAMKAGQTLSTGQVKAIVALVSGAVKGVPKENVAVVDDKLALLTSGLYTSADGTTGAADATDNTTSTDKQQQLTQSYEKTVSDKLTNMLEAIYGKDKVKVQVNADLDFNAVQSDTTTYDPKNVVVSEHNVVSGNGTVSTKNTGSTVDNNMTNSITTGTTGTGNTNSIDSTKNYDVNSTETKTIQAPGAIKKLTTSVALDGNLDPATKASVNNLVSSATGYDAKRGDKISIEGVLFDTTAQDNAKADLVAIQKAADQASKMTLYKNIGIGVGVLALIGFIIFMVLKSKDDKEERGDDILAGIPPRSIDAIIDDAGVRAKSIQSLDPAQAEIESQRQEVEDEIKKYARNKPDQVADVVKSWLSEDER